MSVLLHTSAALPPPARYSHWFALTGSDPRLDPATRLVKLGHKLEQAFDAIAEDWWRIGRDLATAPGGELAHTPTAASFNSDFGQCLAWARLVRDAAADDETTLVVCDDPWLFRHLAGIDGVVATTPPGFAGNKLKLWLRGWVSRTWLAARMLIAALATRGQRANAGKGAPVLLVYGHPRSTADGFDAYFGTMMDELPRLNRVVHTDCPPGRASELAADNRTASLHAWGSPLFALTLPFTCWKPTRAQETGAQGWLVQRAKAFENGTGALAMTRWQIHCQNRWLAAVRPKSVSWSWENHPWERAFVRCAADLDVHTIGSQDTDVGRHQLNMSPAPNPDGLQSIPSIIICNGPAYRDELLAWGVPENRLVIGGSYRIEKFTGDHYDPAGPVFVALSSNPAISAEMMWAVKAARNGTRTFIVKDHPMYPFAFSASEDIRPTQKTIPESFGISAVFYGTGLSGLEGLLSGAPTFRLLPSDRLGIDTLPAGCPAKTVSSDELGAALDENSQPPNVDWNDLFVPVDLEVWREHLYGSDQ